MRGGALEDRGFACTLAELDEELEELEELASLGILFLETGDFFFLEILDFPETFFLETLALGAGLAATLEIFFVETTFFLKRKTKKCAEHYRWREQKQQGQRD